MSVYALIQNNIVVNTVLCDSDTDAAAIFTHFRVVNIDNIFAGVGWSYDGERFTPPPVNKSQQSSG